MTKPIVPRGMVPKRVGPRLEVRSTDDPTMMLARMRLTLTRFAALSSSLTASS